MNFFDHKDLGNHLLQLCHKVVEHPVYIYIYIYCILVWNTVTLAYLCVSPCSSGLVWREWTPNSRFLRYLREKEGQQWHPTSQSTRFRLLGQVVPIVLWEVYKGVSCDIDFFFLVMAVLQVRTGAERRSLVAVVPTLAWCRAVAAVPLCACVVKEFVLCVVSNKQQTPLVKTKHPIPFV